MVMLYVMRHVYSFNIFPVLLLYSDFQALDYLKFSA